MVTDYEYRGARALVVLHEIHLKEFVGIWREAKERGLEPGGPQDSDYATLETVCRHVLRAARGYMTWICQVLELPDPQIRPAPEAALVESEAEEYVEHLLERWRTPLARVPEERFYRPEYPSRWKVLYCVDAMLEHAVMHPVRHGFQLKERMGLQREP